MVKVSYCDCWMSCPKFGTHDPLVTLYQDYSNNFDLWKNMAAGGRASFSYICLGKTKKLMICSLENLKIFVSEKIMFSSNLTINSEIFAIILFFIKRHISDVKTS